MDKIDKIKFMKKDFEIYCEAIDVLRKAYEDNKIHVFPYVVNMAFGVELGFKYFLLENDKEINDMHHHINKMYEEFTLIDSISFELFKFLLEKGYPAFENNKIIEDQFEILDNIFIKLRYFYDYPNELKVNVGFLETLLDFFKFKIITNEG